MLDTVKSFSSENEVKHYMSLTENIGLWESEKKKFTQYLKLTDRILDLGCGTGRATFGLYNLGYKNIMGTDFSNNMIKSANDLSAIKNIPIKFIVADATRLQIKDSFNVVIFSFNGLMMIPKESMRLKAMLEIEKILEPNGYFIFTTHDRNACKEKYFNFWNEEKLRWLNDTYDSPFRLQKKKTLL